MKRSGLLVLALAAAAFTLFAHDTWLVPTAFFVMPGTPVKVALNTSEDFPTSEAAAAPDRIAQFETVSASGRTPVTGYRVEGTSLVADVIPGPGITLVAAVTHPRLIVLKPDEFNIYITEEGLGTVVTTRRARGQSNKEGRERYSKIAKLALCAAGAGEASHFRQPLGLRVEIIPLSNPCELIVGGTLEVQVLFDRRPLPNVWLGAGTQGTHGHHYPVKVRTNAEGRATVSFERPGPWFVRVLHMLPSVEFPDADWQSWFSTLTFAVR